MSEARIIASQTSKTENVNIYQIEWITNKDPIIHLSMIIIIIE